MPETHRACLHFTLLCRAGFEKETVGEITDIAAHQGIHGYGQANPGTGFVQFICTSEDDARQLERYLQPSTLVFARDVMRGPTLLDQLPVQDRLTPVLAAVSDMVNDHNLRFGDLRVLTPDTNTGKELSALCKGFTVPLRTALKKQGLLQEGDRSRATLQLIFLSSTRALLGYSRAGLAAPWAGGVSRLKFPHQAPSRSTLKLEEALLLFLNGNDRKEWLRQGLTAVDLGAAPGGWTWQLVKHGLQVTAIDNGNMDPALMSTGLVEHLRVDGFRYRPERPVCWLVCDMIEQPARVATLMAEWLARGDCQNAMFNLKLPMKKRLDEVHYCRDLIDTILDRAGVPYTLQMRQLYHDREEVTACLRR